MAGQNIQHNIEQLLHRVFSDNSIVYDHSRFAGGLTNYNYFVEINGQEYVVREPGISTELIIDRKAEYANNRISSDLKINSECIYFDSDSGIKISRRIPNAENFAMLDPGSHACLKHASSLLKLLHTSKSNFPNVFDWVVELERYENIVQALRGALFFNYKERKYQLMTFIYQNIKSLDPLPCHNDTVPENFLMDVNDERSFLIDWEYSGMNDPAWDIAMYILESRLSSDSINRFIEAYYGTADPGSEIIMKLKCMCMSQDLLWSIWAIIRHYSGEDFLEYLNMRYDRFSKNLSELSKDSNYPLSEIVK